MRFSPLLSKVLFTFSNFTRLRTPHQIQAHLAQLRPVPLRSMSGIPFLGALFGSSSSSSSKMSYPDQRSDDEWRAVLNKGTCVQSGRPRYGVPARGGKLATQAHKRRAIPHPP